MPVYSYHDVEVYADGVFYKPSENYALELSCTKAGGWQLWYHWGGETKQLGGEFHSVPFCVVVGGKVICGKRPKVEQKFMQFCECGHPYGSHLYWDDGQTKYCKMGCNVTYCTCNEFRPADKE